MPHEVEHNVPRETLERLRQYRGILLAENEHQNLIASSTLESIWERHILDSLQLMALAGTKEGDWLDIGSGAGLPGMVIAIARPTGRTILVEPRSLRADFLRRCATELRLSGQVTVMQDKIEHVAPHKVGIISARAVAALHKLFQLGMRFAGPDTLWLLPKGRSAPEELAEARKAWQGDFHLEASKTDPAAWIVVARGVKPRVSR